MATFDHIFIKSAATLDNLAVQVARTLNMELTKTEDGEFFLQRPASGGQPGNVGGELTKNFYSSVGDDPEEESVIDNYQFVWGIDYTGRVEEIRKREAAQLFQELAAAGQWPVVLLWQVDALAAAALPGRDITWFPPGTSPDHNQRDVWAAFA